MHMRPEEITGLLYRHSSALSASKIESKSQENVCCRDNDLATAKEYAAILVNSTADLDAKVNDTSNFNSDVAFAGMMSLANEVTTLTVVKSCVSLPLADIPSNKMWYNSTSEYKPGSCATTVHCALGSLDPA